MFKVILFVLNSVLFSVAAEAYGSPVATSYSTRVDGQDKGVDFGRGFSKKYGYQKVVVTTYLMPKLVPAASYSTYVIHPVGMKPCGYTESNSADADTLQQFQVKSKETIPVNEYMKDLSAEDDKDASESQFRNVYENDYNNMIREAWGDDWFKDDETKEDSMESDVKDEKSKSDIDAYWDRLKKEFDAYYDEQFNKFFNRQPYESKKWKGHPFFEHKMPFMQGYDGDYDDSSEEVKDDTVKAELKFDHGDFDYGYDLANHYDPKW